MKRLKIIFMVAAIMSTTICLAQQDKIEAQRKIIATLEQQVSDGEKAIASIRKGKADNQARAISLAAQVETRSRLLTAQQRQVTMLRSEIAKRDASSARLSERLDSTRTTFAATICEAYRNYQHDSFLTYLFTSKDLKDISRKLSNLRAVSQLRQRQIIEIDSLASNLSRERAELTKRKASLDKVVADLTSQKRNLERDVNTAHANIKQMSTREMQMLQQREMQQRQLDAAIEELRILSRGNTAGASFNEKTTHLSLPVAGGRVKRYKENMAEVLGQAGSKIISIYDGKVVDIKRNRITGKYDIYIAHGEYIASYAGLASVSVKKESLVREGEAIGTIAQAVDIITMQSEYKIVFGIYPPEPTQRLSAASLFKK